MSVIQIILSHDVLTAAIIYAFIALISVYLFERVHDRLEHPILQWQWDHIGMPLLRAGLVLLFIALAWPAIFGVSDAPTLGSLLAGNKMRFDYLLNVIFIVTLLFPLIPLIGEWEELILPVQGITATAMTFSWLAEATGRTNVHYWPGLMTVMLIIVIAVITHSLALTISYFIGERIDKKLHVSNAGELLARALVIFMQYPVVVIYSHALGRQL